METEAVFENIALRIQNEIDKAEKAIFIAVAWFTNKTLFDHLLVKAQNGCAVSLIISNDAINLGSQNSFDELNKFQSKYYKVGDGESDLMHNKFCVIDFSTVITGSYNWSYKAETNFENIIINYNDTALAEQFISEFKQIVRRYYPNEVFTEKTFPLDRVIKRLEILRNYVSLGDEDEIVIATQKLSDYAFNSDVFEITTLLKEKSYAEAVIKIQAFISRNLQIALWSDPEIFALKLEIRNLENQLNAFDNEKSELEKRIFEFNHRHSVELGEIILEILRLRKVKFKDDKEKSTEAEEDYSRYNQQLQDESKKQLFELTDEERLELKKKFRKATFFCHPDKVNDEMKSAAEKIFVELKSAYEANDLRKVTEILNELERGNFFKSKSESVSEKDKLKASIILLRRLIKRLENEILSIKQNETFKTITSIENMDSYFQEIKEKLDKELETLRQENLS